MIRASAYRLTPRDDRPSLPVGISLDVPILRKRLLRKAALPPQAQRYMDMLRDLLDLGEA